MDVYTMRLLYVNIIFILTMSIIVSTFAGCMRFGANDNPPMRIPVADDRQG